MMETSHSQEASSDDRWIRTAIQYAEEYGWQIVPLDPQMSSSPDYSDDPVERKLGCHLLIDPEEATSDPSLVENWDHEFPIALIGARTGEQSDLVAVEVEKGKASDVRGYFASAAPEAPRILSARREYFLFRVPDGSVQVPRMTESEGATLHGEGSVIRLPWKYYKWSLDQDHEGELVPLPTAVHERFGIDQERGEAETSTPAEDECPRSDPPFHLLSESRAEHTARSPERHSDAPSESPPDDTLFRSGNELERTPDRHETFSLPWLVPGGLSILVGPPKTSGKSTWALNLASHLASCEPFLGQPSQRGDAVVLADTGPRAFRRLLQRVDVLNDGDRDRLHVLHPQDVSTLHWQNVLQRTYSYARQINAGVVIIDCLDQYIRMKDGPTPTEDAEVARALTVEAPNDCPILGVKSLCCDSREPFSRTVERLGVLGRAADAVLRLDDVSSGANPSLRCLRAISRMGKVPRPVYCVLQNGRYVRVQQEETKNGLDLSQLRGPPMLSNQSKCPQRLQTPIQLNP